MTARKIDVTSATTDPRDADLEPDNDDVAVTVLDTITPKRVEWLWQGRIPAGMVTMVDGDPDLGKSTMLLDIAARVSCGREMPDGSAGPPAGGVIIMSSEDDLERVIVPRLQLAGASLERIATVAFHDRQGERDPEIVASDLERLRSLTESMNVRLLISDPLVAFLPTNINANRDQDVRRALKDLKRFAGLTGVAVVCLRHLNKGGGGNPLYRGGGSIGILGAARSGLIVAKDPDNDTLRILAVNKCNLAPKAPSLCFSLEGHPSGHALVQWRGTSTLSATALLATPNAEDAPAINEAIGFLRELLRDGPVQAKNGILQASKTGISRRTLERARQLAGVDSYRPHNPGEWYWMLSSGISASASASERNGDAW